MNTLSVFFSAMAFAISLLAGYHTYVMKTETDAALKKVEKAIELHRGLSNAIIRNATP